MLIFQLFPHRARRRPQLQISFLPTTEPVRVLDEAWRPPALHVNLSRNPAEMKTRHRTVVPRAQRLQVPMRMGQKKPDCEMTTSDDMNLQAAIVVAEIDR